MFVRFVSSEIINSCRGNVLFVWGIENFIQDALDKPNDYIAYHIGRELAKLHPAKVIIEGETAVFDLEAFVRAENAWL